MGILQKRTKAHDLVGRRWSSGSRGCVGKPTLTRESPVTVCAAAGPLRRSLKGARAVGAAPTYANFEECPNRAKSVPRQSKECATRWMLAAIFAGFAVSSSKLSKSEFFRLKVACLLSGKGGRDGVAKESRPNLIITPSFFF
jgi:hypothetical protein